MIDEVRYALMDPTSNVTILVETPVPVEDQPEVASILMQKEPTAEQVGFLSLDNIHQAMNQGRIALRMAGGEFCGNASMSAAALVMIKKAAQGSGERQTQNSGERQTQESGECQTQESGKCQTQDSGKWQTQDSGERQVALYDEQQVTLTVSGAAEPVHVRITAVEASTFVGSVEMPRPVRIEETSLPGGYHVPAVFFQGIVHLILEDVTMSREEAEACAKSWCGYLQADALGLMFVNKELNILTPLVYVPAADTLFWESSCGSGTTAVGAWLAENEGRARKVSLRQPGGTLEILAAPKGPFILKGKVRFLYEKTLPSLE